MCGCRQAANGAGRKPESRQSSRRRQLALVAALMSALVVVGVVNFVLVKVLYVAFRSGDGGSNTSVANQSMGTSAGPSNSSFANGSQYSFFVNQARSFPRVVVVFALPASRSAFGECVGEEKKKNALHLT